MPIPALLLVPLLLDSAAPAAITVPASCAGKDGWSDPTVPQKIAAKVWYVGTCGISVVLISSPRGHIVIDGGPRDAGALVAHSIEAAGFRLHEVRWIVSSHEHNDHAGGIAELKRLTGARVAATSPNAAVLRTGVPAPVDPQAGDLSPFSPVKVERVLVDGETLRLGPIALTAHNTPGHSPGSTSWTWTSCERSTCHRFAYADSVSAISATGYRFADHTAYVANFRRALATIAGLQCDVLITPHPAVSHLFDKLAGTAPLVNPAACREYAAQGLVNLEARLAKEAAGK